MAAEEPGIEPSDIPDDLFKEAVRWLARLREPEATARTRDEFQRWLEHDPRHARAYDQAARLWGALDEPARTAAADNREAIAALIASARANKASRVTRRVAGGLAIVVCMVATSWWYNGGVDNLRADYVTAPGHHQRYVLDDGTTIDLNTDSALAVDLKPDHRSIHLFRGEVFVTVAHDAERPFTLTTREGRVLDIGTAFNVRIKGANTVVSLVEGRVEVSALADPSREIGLDPGEEIAVGSAGLGATERFDTSSVAAWRAGRMVFYQTPLGDVVDELNRYQRGRIVIAGERLRTLPVTGVFSTSNPAEVIQVIEATLGVSALHLTSALTVLH